MPITRSQRKYIEKAGLSAYYNLFYNFGPAYMEFEPSQTKSMAPIPKMNQQQGNENSIQNMSHAYVTVNAGNAPIKRIEGQYIDYVESFPLEFSWESNQQKFFDITHLGAKSQYTTSTAATTTNRWRVSYQNFFGLSPNQGQTTGSIVTGATAPNSDWAGIKACTVYMDFSNETNLPCFAKLHWFKATTDLTSDPLFCYDDSATKNYIYDTTYTQSGIAKPTASGNENPAYSAVSVASTPVSMITIPYTNLTSRRAVVQNWQPVKTHKFTLAGGDTYRITSNVLCNMFQSKDILDNKDEYPQGSLCCIVEFQGGAARAIETEATNGGPYDIPVLAAGQVSVIITRKFKLCKLKSPQARYDLSYNAMPNNLVGPPIAKTKLIGDTEVGVDTGAEL